MQDIVPRFPDLNLPTATTTETFYDDKIVVWLILLGVLVALTLFLLLTQKNK